MTFKRHLIFLMLLISGSTLGQENQPNRSNEIEIPLVDDFEVNGQGDSDQWKKTDWIDLEQRKTDGKTYSTSVKLLYSATGIYVLFRCEDDEITSTLRRDFADLWTEDVVEIFFWPDESLPVYFEYELSPHNYELPIVVPNRDGFFLGWKPWKYEGKRLTRHATTISTVNDKTWTAEFFIPLELMKPLAEGMPAKGSRWRVNMYRIDYDDGVSTWSWQPVRTNFHDYESYGTLVFN